MSYNTVKSINRNLKKWRKQIEMSINSIFLYYITVFILLYSSYGNTAESTFCEEITKEIEQTLSLNKSNKCGFYQDLWNENINEQKQRCLKVSKKTILDEEQSRKTKIEQCTINKKLLKSIDQADYQLVSELLEQGASIHTTDGDPNDSGDAFYYLVCGADIKHQKDSFIKALKKALSLKPNVMFSSCNGCSSSSLLCATELALEKNSTDVLALILSSPNISYSLNASGEFAADDFTPLHVAIRHGNIKIIEMLIKYGASPNYSVGLENHPLLTAIKMKRPEPVKLLLAQGALAHIRDQGECKGKSALEYAEETGVKEIIFYISEALKKQKKQKKQKCNHNPI